MQQHSTYFFLLPCAENHSIKIVAIDVIHYKYNFISLYSPVVIQCFDASAGCTLQDMSMESPKNTHTCVCYKHRCHQCLLHLRTVIFFVSGVSSLLYPPGKRILLSATTFPFHFPLFMMPKLPLPIMSPISTSLFCTSRLPMWKCAEYRIQSSRYL